MRNWTRKELVFRDWDEEKIAAFLSDTNNVYEIGTDESGQLVVYTGLKAEKDGLFHEREVPLLDEVLHRLGDIAEYHMIVPVFGNAAMTVVGANVIRCFDGPLGSEIILEVRVPV